jgi:hypothetical protein
MIVGAYIMIHFGALAGSHFGALTSLIKRVGETGYEARMGIAGAAGYYSSRVTG